MAAVYVGAPAVPLGFDFGLPVDEFVVSLDDFDMTADHSVVPFLDTSDLDASSLDYWSPSSEWASKSPGRQSQDQSNAAVSSSPGQGSLILTPTSTNSGDVFVNEDPEPADQTGDSPGSSFSSSDDYVHVDRLAGGQARGGGRRAMTSNRAPHASGSGVPSTAHQARPSTTASAIGTTNTQATSFPSTTAAGGWMDGSQFGQWGQFDPSAHFGITTGARTNAQDEDILSTIGPTGNHVPRTFDNGLPFRTVSGSDNAFTAASPLYSLQPQYLQFPASSSGAQYYLPAQYTSTQGMQYTVSQPFPQRLAVPPTLPSQLGGTLTQNFNTVPRRPQQDDRSVSSSSNSASPTMTRAHGHPAHTQSAVQAQQTRLEPLAQQPQPLNVPFNIPVIRSSRQLQPANAGRSRAAGPSALERLNRRGGRQKGSNLAERAREKSGRMRKAVACWHCALQRDPCDEGTPCSRCIIKSQKGNQYFFECDRSKLPDLVHDFLPPTMTSMHQKQSIEDSVCEHVLKFDKTNFLDVYLTTGYGPPLKWRLYEFIPKGQELLGQFQYLRDTSTGTSRRATKYSPPFALIKLDTSDDTHVESYLKRLLQDDTLWDFGWTFFEEETGIDDFQARLLQLMCDLYLTKTDPFLHDLLQKIIRMMVITYIMGHTLTILEDTVYDVLNAVQHSPKPDQPAPHTSPRLANRQLKFFFCVLRNQIYDQILSWQQQTFRTSAHKEDTWLQAFCVMLGFAMVLEEVQRTLWIQADAKAAKGDMPFDQAEREAVNACERVDKRFGLLVGLFQCKYRDRKWTTGSFGPQTPELRDPAERNFLNQVYQLLIEKQYHLATRENFKLSSENQCYHTSRLVARFLLPFLRLPA